jgi:hypothetical protein
MYGVIVYAQSWFTSKRYNLSIIITNVDISIIVSHSFKCGVKKGSSPHGGQSKPVCAVERPEQELPQRQNIPAFQVPGLHVIEAVVMNE